MPTPVYRFRLSMDDRKNLEEVAKLYGAPNPSAFLREMVGAICSNDQKRMGEFFARLVTKMGEQLALDFAEKARETASGTKQTLGKGKGAPRRAKRS